MFRINTPSPENAMKTLADAFEHTLQDVYYAENAIVKALPKVIDAVSNADLKTALKDHLGETKGQIKTLQAVFKSIGKKASGEKCDAIEGLIKETQGVIEDSNGSVAKHAAIIGCCQAVEHYEISRYGTLREWAKALGETEAHALLTEILDQESATMPMFYTGRSDGLRAASGVARTKQSAAMALLRPFFLNQFTVTHCEVRLSQHE
jgi:ferritin-like metal-binding protein YciE